MAQQGWEEAAALFGRSGRPRTTAPDLKGGDVSKGQACSFLPGAGRETWRRPIELVGPQRTKCALKLALQR